MLTPVLVSYALGSIGGIILAALGTFTMLRWQASRGGYKRLPAAEPVQHVIMMRDPVDNHVEVWTRYGTLEGAIEALPVLKEIYGDTKIFWLKGRPEPGLVREQSRAYLDSGVPTLEYLIAKALPPTVPVLTPDYGPHLSVIVPGEGPGPYGVTGSTRGIRWYVAERFYGENQRERAMDALVKKYPPGSSLIGGM